MTPDFRLIAKPKTRTIYYTNVQTINCSSRVIRNLFLRKARVLLGFVFFRCRSLGSFLPPFCDKKGAPIDTNYTIQFGSSPQVPSKVQEVNDGRLNAMLINLARVHPEVLIHANQSPEAED